MIPIIVASTAAFIEHLSDLVDGGQLTYPVEQLVLRRLINQQDCPLCCAPAGCMCHTDGGQNLRRTHLVRLQVASSADLAAAIRWAVLEHDRQCRER